MSSNIIDILIVAIFLFSIIVAFARGLVSEIISLATLVAAFIVATMFTHPLANVFTGNSSVKSMVSDSSVATGINTSAPISYIALGLSFCLLFFITIIIGSIVKTLLNSAVSTGILSFGNRVMGAIFGIMKGYLLNICLIFVLQLTPISGTASWQQAQYLGYFQSEVNWLNERIAPTLGALKTKLGTTLEGVGANFQDLTKKFN